MIFLGGVCGPLAPVASLLFDLTAHGRLGTPAPVVSLLLLHFESSDGHAHVFNDLGTLLLSLQSVGLLIAKLFYEILYEILGLRVHIGSLQELRGGLVIRLELLLRDLEELLHWQELVQTEVLTEVLELILSISVSLGQIVEHIIISIHKVCMRFLCPRWK